jgi:hypothetical protein
VKRRIHKYNIEELIIKKIAIIQNEKERRFTLGES